MVSSLLLEKMEKSPSRKKNLSKVCYFLMDY